MEGTRVGTNVRLFFFLYYVCFIRSGINFQGLKKLNSVSWWFKQSNSEVQLSKKRTNGIKQKRPILKSFPK